MSWVAFGSFPDSPLCEFIDPKAVCPLPLLVGPTKKPDSRSALGTR